MGAAGRPGRGIERFAEHLLEARWPLAFQDPGPGDRLMRRPGSDGENGKPRKS